MAAVIKRILPFVLGLGLATSCRAGWLNPTQQGFVIQTFTSYQPISGNNSGVIVTNGNSYQFAGDNTGYIYIGGPGSQFRGVNDGSLAVNGAGSFVLGSFGSLAMVTNLGKGSLLLGNLSVGQKAVITDVGNASILLGAGVVSNSQAIVVGDGNESHGLRSVTADSFWGMGSGFHGDGSSLVGITAAQVGAAESEHTNLTLAAGAHGGEVDTLETVMSRGNLAGRNIYFGKTNSIVDAYSIVRSADEYRDIFTMNLVSGLVTFDSGWHPAVPYSVKRINFLTGKLYNIWAVDGTDEDVTLDWMARQLKSATNWDGYHVWTYDGSEIANRRWVQSLTSNLVAAETLQAVVNRGNTATNAMALGVGVTATGRCAFAHGVGPTWTTGIQADGAGSTAMGANDSSGGTRMMATGKGSLAGGYITSTYIHGGGVHADGVGAFAWNEGAWAKHDWSVVFSDTEWTESPTSKTFTVSMANGIYLKGGTTEVENAASGKGAVNYRTMTNYLAGAGYLTAGSSAKWYAPESAFSFDGAGSITGYSGTNTELRIPPTIGGVPVTAIGNFAFQGRTNIVRLVLPESVKTVGAYTFSGCYELTSADMPGAISIGHSAFRDCYRLASISVPKVVYIEDNAFISCFGLTAVSLPSVQTIGSGAYSFFNCTNLVSVSVPVVTWIAPMSFLGCTKLASVYFSGNAPTLGTYVDPFTSQTMCGVFSNTAPAIAYYPQGRTGYDMWGYALTNTWVQNDNIYSLSVNGVVPDAKGNISLGAVWKTNVWWAYASSNATEKTAFTNIYLGR